MKSAPDSSKLDAFIRETLKASDANLQPVDWSEVEVLLRHEQKSLPVEINKKTIVYSAAGVVALLLLFGILKIIQHYSSLPPEPETSADSTQSILPVVDTLKPAHIDSIVVKPDTTKTDTAHPVINPPKIDSSGINKSHKKPDSGSVAAPLMPDSAWIRRVQEKKDKKRKQAIQDTTTIKTGTVLPVAEPTPVIPEPTPINPGIEKETIPTPDTAKIPAAPQNSTKKKKSKAKKEPAPALTPPAEIKSDSLKQQ